MQPNILAVSACRAGRTPNQVAAEQLEAKTQLVNPAPTGRARPRDATKARRFAQAAKEVSQPDI